MRRLVSGTCHSPGRWLEGLSLRRRQEPRLRDAFQSCSSVGLPPVEALTSFLLLTLEGSSRQGAWHQFPGKGRCLLWGEPPCLQNHTKAQTDSGCSLNETPISSPRGSPHNKGGETGEGEKDGGWVWNPGSVQKLEAHLNSLHTKVVVRESTVWVREVEFTRFLC